MTFSSFFDEFPELVDTEFRNIFIVDNETYQHIPAGNYGFLELFCRDTDCDCRNVMINVITLNPYKVWAVLRYGWESKKFYRKWFGRDEKLIQKMAGTSIDLFISPHNSTTQEFLKIFTTIIQGDRQYAKRIKTHYQMFKEKVQNKLLKQLPAQPVVRGVSGKKPGRNDPCPCDSGKKFKKMLFCAVIPI